MKARSPVRTCVACRQEASKRSLMRLVRAPSGAAELDPSGRARGRGAYLHAAEACIELARRRRALERALRAQVPPELWPRLAAMVSEAGAG